MASDQEKPVQPVSGTVVPRYAGPSTFARLPDVPCCDVAILGVPFDAGTSYRPGARFGPLAIRQASRHLRTQFHPAYDHAELTSLAAATVIYELVNLFARSPADRRRASQG
jgi:guanidinobutyrase / D-arginase